MKKNNKLVKEILTDVNNIISPNWNAINQMLCKWNNSKFKKYENDVYDTIDLLQDDGYFKNKLFGISRTRDCGRIVAPNLGFKGLSEFGLSELKKCHITESLKKLIMILYKIYNFASQIKFLPK